MNPKTAEAVSAADSYATSPAPAPVFGLIAQIELASSDGAYQSPIRLLVPCGAFQRKRNSFLPGGRMSRAGFTLLELLVVIAVIGVLILLASSAVGTMRKQMQSATCIQRLRSIGTALMAFAGDHQGKMLPRSHGLYREPGEANIPVIDRPWPNRLVRENYAASPDIFYCPSFTPQRNQLASTPLPSSGKIQTYGLRVWTMPGATGYWENKEREELKPLVAITEPADFFIAVDTIWIHPSYKSQGYGISPGMAAEQLIHLRHGGKANALFADGHVEAKKASYFADLHTPGRQRAYSGGQSLPFGVTEQMEWP